MKNTVIVILCLALAGFAFAASNNATINQAGNDHEADVQQSGSSNAATITQNGGNGNTLGNPQSGDPGINVGSESDNVSLAKGLVQEGNNNSATITQTGNSNVVQQFRELRGVLNSVYQKGDANSLNISQVGDNNVVGQAVYEYDGLDQKGNSNAAAITQSGNSNKLHVFYQKDDNNVALIAQTGNNNRISSATQKLLGAGPAGNYLNIDQDGDNNIIDNAGEEGAGIIGTVTQTGNSNRAGMQLSRYAAFGDIDQIGDGNRATLTINKSYIGDSNSGDIDQIGNDNIATQAIGQSNPATTSAVNSMVTYQSGDANDADILIEGSNNQATINQTGVGSHVADIVQTGDLNIASITSDGTGHTGSINQTGNMNNALITQN